MPDFRSEDEIIRYFEGNITREIYNEIVNNADEILSNAIEEWYSDNPSDEEYYQRTGNFKNLKLNTDYGSNYIRFTYNYNEIDGGPYLRGHFSPWMDFDSNSGYDISTTVLSMLDTGSTYNKRYGSPIYPSYYHERLRDYLLNFNIKTNYYESSIEDVYEEVIEKETNAQVYQSSSSSFVSKMEAKVNGLIGRLFKKR